jgi:hypothetical protein
MADSPVLLFSTDPFLGAALEAVSDGSRSVVKHALPSDLSEWPNGGPYNVVLDVPPSHRKAAYETIRLHHQGRLILVLGPDEDDADLPRDAARLAVHRPIDLASLLRLLAEPIADTDERDGETGADDGSLRAPEDDAWPGQGKDQPDSGAAATSAQPVATLPYGVAVDWDVGGAAEGDVRPTPTGPVDRTEPAEPWWETDLAGAGPAAEPSGRPLGGVAGRRHSRGVLLGALVMVAACLAAFGLWLLLGLNGAAQDVRKWARETRNNLDKVNTALNAGDVAAADDAVHGAGLGLDAADGVLGRRPVRVAARLPVLSGPVRDLEHLLAAGRAGTRAADHAVTLYASFGSGRPLLLHDGRFDFKIMSRATDHAERLNAELARAEQELKAVRGGPLDPEVIKAKQTGLDQIADLRGRTRLLSPLLGVLPHVLGRDGPRQYLIVLANPAESRPGGGSPTAALRLTIDKGVVRLEERHGSVAQKLHHAAVTWTASPADPWRPGPSFHRFSDANSSPHFPTSAEELLRAYRAASGRHVDGVISVDPMAMRALLAATGPLRVTGWGELTAQNIGPLTMHDAFELWPDRQVRRDRYERLIGTMLQRFLDGKRLLDNARALGTEARGRHLQLYLTTPAVQRLIVGSYLDGALRPAEHDYLAVFTKNTNNSRVDFFQRRTTRQVVRLEEDGSATVTREIQVSNPTPSSDRLRTGPRDGYASRFSDPILAVYLPPKATLRSVAVNGSPVRARHTTEARRPFVRTQLRLLPNGASTVTIVYRLPAAAERTEDGLRYQLVADNQSLAVPPTLEVTVVPPPQMVARASPGWKVGPDSATLRRRFAASFDTQLEIQMR